MSHNQRDIDSISWPVLDGVLALFLSGGLPWEWSTFLFLRSYACSVIYSMESKYWIKWDCKARALFLLGWRVLLAAPAHHRLILCSMACLSTLRTQLSENPPLSLLLVFMILCGIRSWGFSLGLHVRERTKPTGRHQQGSRSELRCSFCGWLSHFSVRKCDCIDLQYTLQGKSECRKACFSLKVSVSLKVLAQNL